MFTLIQTILQKHHKVVFTLLLAVIVVAFVFTIGNFSPVNTTAGGGSARAQSFYGIVLGSNEHAAMTDMTARSAIMNGQQIGTQQELATLTLARIAALYVANQLDIPEPSDAQVEQAIRRLPMFADPQTGEFSEELFTAHIDALKASNENAGRSLRTVIAQDIRLEAVQRLAMGPGYVTNLEVAEYFRLQTQTVDTIVAYIDPAPAQGPPSEQQLQTFIDENPTRFAPPPRYKLDYTVLRPGAFQVDDLQLSQGQLRSYFRQNQSDFADEEGNVPAFDSVQAEVRAAMLAELSRQEVAGVAEELGFAVQSGDLAPGSDAFKERMEALGLVVASLPSTTPERISQALRPVQTQEGAEPADVENPLADTPFQAYGNEFLRNFVQALQSNRLAFALRLDEGAVGLVILRGTETFDPPPLDEIREEVAAAYDDVNLRQNVAQRAGTLRPQIESRLAAGEDFEAIAEDLGLSTSRVNGVSINAPPVSSLAPSQVLAQTPVGGLTPVQVDVDPITEKPVGRMIFIAAKQSPNFVPGSAQALGLRNALANRARESTFGGFVMELIVQGQPEGFNLLGDG
ncbi:MAG: hypothetical protein ACFB20_08985 [Opitutales bacterium]